MLSHYITPLIATECVKKNEIYISYTFMLCFQNGICCVTEPLKRKSWKNEPQRFAESGAVQQQVFQRPCLHTLQGCGVGQAWRHFTIAKYLRVQGLFVTACFFPVQHSIMSLKANAQSPEEHRSLTEMLKQENSSEDAGKKGWQPWQPSLLPSTKESKGYFPCD